MIPNFKLANAIRLSRKTQAEVVRLAGLSSESRLSRIINGYETPREAEVEAICGVLNHTPDDLGFQTKGTHS